MLSLLTSLAMLNATFSVILKHCGVLLSLEYEKVSYFKPIKPIDQRPLVTQNF